MLMRSFIPVTCDKESIKTRERLRLIKEKVNAMKSTTKLTNNDTISKDASDAKEMLASIGLSIYFKNFLENKMIGMPLLDLTDRDLDYMNIRILAHRKSILKATHELKQMQKGTNDEKEERHLFQGAVLEWRMSKDCVDPINSVNNITNSGSSWSRKVATLRQDVEESREADMRKRPSTSDAVSNEFDSEDQEHQVRVNRVKIYAIMYL